MKFNDAKPRCDWIKDHPLYLKYHDEEWGIPVYDDCKLFELLILESAEAGLNWLLILQKRENYRLAYHGFNPIEVAKFTAEKESELINNSGIVRSQLKIRSSIQNAKMFLEVQKQYGSFSNYIWNYVEHKPILNEWKSTQEVPDETQLSRSICQDMKNKGFTFIGPKMIYAFMQAIGIVNDHPTYCFKYHKYSSNDQDANADLMC
ncbi:DNA-3-methyladenine glycosylase I [Candidatus Tisiphia endosymbiont of Nemotelus uliginosus]|uniref:DNA-3-methyladenine glycosylase I n=1 Tax=Candidatus Tisiphia endosymbiont of Nemotelus uliginosus TaxID=3077926 RepID=UPI0035C8DAA6